MVTTVGIDARPLVAAELGPGSGAASPEPWEWKHLPADTPLTADLRGALGPSGQLWTRTKYPVHTEELRLDKAKAGGSQPRGLASVCHRQGRMDRGGPGHSQAPCQRCRSEGCLGLQALPQGQLAGPGCLRALSSGWGQTDQAWPPDLVGLLLPSRLHTECVWSLDHILHSHKGGQCRPLASQATGTTTQRPALGLETPPTGPFHPQTRGRSSQLFAEP